MAQGKCSICENEGKIEKHHIISRAKIGRLKPGDHGHDLDLMKNPGNLIQLCIPCHELTDSHAYWRWMNSIENKITTNKGRKKRGGRRKKKGARHQCVGVKLDGKRCGQRNRAIPKDGYCYSHVDQAPEGHPQHSIPDYKSSPPPALRDEDDWDNFLDQEHIAVLQDLHMFGGEVSGYELELFANWSEAWRRRWLYREEW